MYSDKNEKKDNKNLFTIFSLFQITFTILITTIIIYLLNIDNHIAYNNYKDLPKITINNLNTIYPSLPKGTDEIIGNKLLERIKQNNPDIDMNTVGNIRKDTISTHHFDESDIDFFSAIIDIPSLEQSYRVFHEYHSKDKEYIPESESLLTITCLIPEDKNIYPNSQCTDNDKKTYRAIIKSYLDEKSYTDFAIFFDEDNPFLIKILPLKEQPDNYTKDSFITQTKSSIESFGIPSNLFEYKVNPFNTLPADY